ncbi:serpin B10-like [Paramacrobiotus metropolitanus]|uniref:serpin B10-like n=1 Tax=Paramacrobiotus metropolitanus TaxID=2943436 RepID=UPI0024459B46|nr:serpin B10-like [Paramacrobiotus metropolitanus]
MDTSFESFINTLTSVNASYAAPPTFSNLINSNTLNLYNAATATAAPGNLMISPFSILYATMLMYIGSSGNTKSNLDSALQFTQIYNGDKSAALTDFSHALSTVKSVSDPQDASKYMIVSVNNGVFVDRTMKLKPDYVENAKSKLKSLAEQKDFRGNSSQARTEINNWVSNNTGGLIKNLLSPDSVNAMTRVVLVNTVYYNATWASEFDKEDTEKRPFTNVDGTEVQVDMMIKTDGFLFSRERDLKFTYAELDYYNGETSMLIVLPDSSQSLRDVEKKLTADGLMKLKSEGRKRRMRLVLPKFKTESKFDLVQLLRQTGVDDAFNGGKANFADMTSERGLYFGSGVHKTFISVDEQGTVAAAASVLSAGRSWPMEFAANRPFLYAIRHNPTNCLLFIGKVEKF